MTGDPTTADASTSAPSRICPECEKQTDQRRCSECRTTTIPALLLEGGVVVGPQVGMVLADQYEMRELLGEGGMGKVFRGVQLSMDRPVAIKVISREISADLASIRRFTREARVTSRLGHPHSIRVFDFGITDEGLFYLVMELLQGYELSAVLDARGKLTLRRSLEICIQTLHALEEAHQLGIVHRDLKPTNLFLLRVAGERDFVKVMDYGIAKSSFNAELARVTQTGMIVGTPTYMSPEQARGMTIDGRSDIYAVGVMLYEMLTGMPPFDDESPVRVLLMHVTQPAPRLADLRPDLPCLEETQKLLDRLMAKDQDGRPRTAEKAALMLQRLLDQVPRTAEDTPDEDNIEGQATVEADVVVVGTTPGTGGRSPAATDPVGVPGKDDLPTPLHTARPDTAVITARPPAFRDPDVTVFDGVPHPARSRGATSMDDVITSVGPAPEAPEPEKAPSAGDDELDLPEGLPDPQELAATQLGVAVPTDPNAGARPTAPAGDDATTVAFAPVVVATDATARGASEDDSAPAAASGPPDLARRKGNKAKRASRSQQPGAGGEAPVAAGTPSKPPLPDAPETLDALADDTSVVPGRKGRRAPRAPGTAGASRNAAPPPLFAAPRGLTSPAGAERASPANAATQPGLDLNAAQDATVSMDVVVAAPRSTMVVAPLPADVGAPRAAHGPNVWLMAVLAVVALIALGALTGLLLFGDPSEDPVAAESEAQMAPEAAPESGQQPQAQRPAAAPDGPSDPGGRAGPGDPGRPAAADPQAPPVAAASTPTQEDEEAADPASAAPDTAPAPPPRVRVVSTPSGASVFDGDRLLGETPMDVTLPPDGKPLRLSLRLEGHADSLLDVDQTRGEEVAIELSRIPAPQPVAAPTAGHAARPAAAPRGPTPAPKATARPKASPAAKATPRPRPKPRPRPASKPKKRPYLME